jgi:ribonucleoside-diphosphate reductase alpha chain
MENVELILYKKYFATVDFVKTYLENRGAAYTVRDEPFCVKEWDRVAISWRRTAVAQMPFRYTDFYNEAGKKRAHSRWLQLPREHLADILHGIIAGYSYTTVDNYVLYETNSRELLECVRFLCLRLGILAGGYKHDAATVAPQDHTYIPSYYLKIPHTAELRAQISCVGDFV